MSRFVEFIFPTDDEALPVYRADGPVIDAGGRERDAIVQTTPAGKPICIVVSGTVPDSEVEEIISCAFSAARALERGAR